MTVNASERDRIRSSVSAELGRSGLRLAFAPELESCFEADTRDSRVRHLVRSGVLALIMSNTFLITDAQVMPDVFGMALTLRLACTIYYSAAIVATALELNAVLREAIHGICLTLGVLGTVALVGQSQAPEHGYACITFVLLISYVNLVTRLRFKWCVAFSTAVTLAVIVSLGTSAPLGPGVKDLVILSVLTASGFTTYANYAMEAGERAAYLLTLDHRLGAEHLADYNARLSALSSTDWLTGAANRRGLEQHLARVWSQCAAYRQPVSLLMVDVDHFKLFNDYRGHPAGDTCLATLSGLIAGQLRQDEDFLGRYGGEEFAVVLPDTSMEEAVVVAERIRQAVEDLGLPHGAPGASSTITVSIGAQAAMPHQSGGPAQLIAGADQALYQSKQNGRNRVHPPLYAFSRLGETHVMHG